MIGAEAPYPPHRPVSVDEARGADLAAVAAGVPSIVLMEHAGRGLATLVARRRAGTGPVVVLCGPGNNGGDGYACARFLASFGVPLRVLAVAGLPSRGDAVLEHALVARTLEVERPSGRDAVARAIVGASVLVDAIYGVGLARPLDAALVGIVTAVNVAPCLRVAADVPTGLDADDGTPRPVAVRADLTAAMGFVKRGCTTAAGAPWCGELVEIDIGLPRGVHARFF
jgi:NAD(P)H-hydrate epimerase